MTITDSEAPTRSPFLEAACEPSESEGHSSTSRVRAHARRSWRLGWLALASPGFTAVIRDVTGLVGMIEDLDIEATYQMTAGELLDVVLAPWALPPAPPRISSRLKTTAAFAGVDPAVLIGWHLAAGIERGRCGLSTSLNEMVSTTVLSAVDQVPQKERSTETPGVRRSNS